MHGTGNNKEFLNDRTGNRRWMPFEVESIRDPRTHPFDHAGIFAQAYALYRQGFRYWLEGDDEEAQEAHNEAFVTPDPVQESICEYFREPGQGEKGELLSATQILKAISDCPAMRFKVEDVGKAMRALHFVPHRSHGKRGYRVVALSQAEKEARRQLLADDARPADESEEGDRGVGIF